MHILPFDAIRICSDSTPSLVYGSRCTVTGVASAVVHIGVTSPVSQTLPHLAEVQTNNVVHMQAAQHNIQIRSDYVHITLC